MRSLRPPLIARCTKTITTPQSSQSRIAKFYLNSTPTEWPLSSSVRSTMVTLAPSKLVLKKSVCSSRTRALLQVPRKLALMHQSSLVSTCIIMSTRSVIHPYCSNHSADPYPRPSSQWSKRRLSNRQLSTPLSPFMRSTRTRPSTTLRLLYPPSAWPISRNKVEV